MSLVADFLKKRKNTPQNQLRGFEVRRMPYAGKDNQAGTVDILSQTLALGRRDEFVFATPQDECGFTNGAMGLLPFLRVSRHDLSFLSNEGANCALAPGFTRSEE